jgi:hypothetical protein
MFGFGLSQHFRRIVHAGDGSMRPTMAQLFRAITGAAAQIDNAGGRFKMDLRNQVGRWPRALVGVFQI